MTTTDAFLSRTAVPRSPSLSAREREVLATWFVCDSKRAVAQRLFVTPATVQTHLARIRAKYQAVGRPAGTKIALFIRALEDGYCTLEDILECTNDEAAGTRHASEPAQSASLSQPPRPHLSSVR